MPGYVIVGLIVVMIVAAIIIHAFLEDDRS